MRQCSTMVCACLALAVAAFAQEGKMGAAGAKQSKACDVKTTEKAPWCTACNQLLEKGDVEKGLHKGKGEDHKVEEVEVCVKKYYAAPCHPEKTSDKPGS